jgi:hypothetical protein
MNSAWLSASQRGVALVLVVFLALTGCSKKPEGPPEGDEAVLRNIVMQLPDRCGNAKTFRTYFAASATIPADEERERYRRYLYNVVGRPTMRGDTATVRVQVRDDDSPRPLGTVSWTFVKEGDTWKAKTISLP